MYEDGGDHLSEPEWKLPGPVCAFAEYPAWELHLYYCNIQVRPVEECIPRFGIKHCSE